MGTRGWDSSLRGSIKASHLDQDLVPYEPEVGLLFLEVWAREVTNEEPGRRAGSLAPVRRDREPQWPWNLGMERGRKAGEPGRCPVPWGQGVGVPRGVLPAPLPFIRPHPALLTLALRGLSSYVDWPALARYPLYRYTCTRETRVAWETGT